MINLEAMNRLSFKCTRFSDGSYLEDQDGWNFSGVYRSISIQRKPIECHIRDYKTLTNVIDEDVVRGDKVRATLEVDVMLKLSGDDDKNVLVRGKLFENGKEVRDTCLVKHAMDSLIS